MGYEFMVLFGGTIVLVVLKRDRTKPPKRIKGFLRIYPMIIETVVALAGIIIFMAGIITFFR